MKPWSVPWTHKKLNFLLGLGESQLDSRSGHAWKEVAEPKKGHLNSSFVRGKEYTRSRPTRFSPMRAVLFFLSPFENPSEDPVVWRFEPSTTKPPGAKPKLSEVT